MKRGGRIQPRATPRRTGMSRGDWDQTANPEPDVDPEPVRKVDRPRTPLKQRSSKTAARKPERDAVRAAVGTACVLAWHSDCGGPLDVHELVRRGQMKDAPYIRELCVPLCRVHHDLDVRMLVAERLGIRMPRWVWDQYGLAAVAECERIRAGRGGTPFWRETHDARWLGIEDTEWHTSGWKPDTLCVEGEGTPHQKG